MLFTTADELVPFLPINESFPFEKINPFLNMVEKDVIKRILGADEYNNLVAAYEGDTMTPEQESLLEEVRVPLANLAFADGMDVIALTIGALGINQTEDGSSKTATNTQIFHMKKSVKALGYKGIESLLEFLEENKDDYDDWVASSEYAESKALFVMGARDFGNNFNRRISRYVYWTMVPIMKRVQKELCIELLSQEMYDQLLEEHLENTISAENQYIIDLIKPALCYASFVKGIEQLVVNVDEDGVTVFSQESLRNVTDARKNADEVRIGILKNEAMNEVAKYTAEIKEILDGNLDGYPLYRDNAYDEDAASEFENDDDDSFYFLG